MTYLSIYKQKSSPITAELCLFGCNVNTFFSGWNHLCRWFTSYLSHSRAGLSTRLVRL